MSSINQFSVYTYIQSRFYRAPEVIMGLPYDMAIDMWSLGCILGLYIFILTFSRQKLIMKYSIWNNIWYLAELYTGLPIFPGENEHEQMACIMEIFSLPPDLVLEKATRKKVFFGKFLKSCSWYLSFNYF